MATRRKVELVIAGDAKGAVGALKDTGDATDGLSTKLGGLGKAALAGFAAIGAGALAGGAALLSIGEQFDSAFDKIRVGTGATGDQLTGLQDSFRDVFAQVPADADQVSTAIADINTRLGLTGDALEDRSTQMLNLSRIIDSDINTVVAGSADVFNNWGIAAADQEAVLDQMFRTTQATGVGWDELSGSLASNGVALRAAGLDISQASALLGSLGQAGLDAGDVMPALTRSLATAAAEGVPAQQMLADTLAVIEQAPNDTAAAAAAMEVFGAKAGPQFAALVREGKLGYDELLGSITTGGDTINGLAAETADFGESFQMLKNNLFLALEEPAGAIFGALGDALTQLSPLISEVGGMLGGVLGHALEQLMPPVMKILEAFTPLLPIFGDLVTMVIDTFAPALVSLADALAPIITQLIEGMRPILDQLKPVFAQLSVTLVDFVQNGIVPMLPSLLELGMALHPLLPPLIQIGAEMLNALLPAIVLLTPLFVDLAEATLQLVVPAVEWLAGGLQSLADWMREVIGQPDELRTNFVRGLEVIKEKAADVFDWFANLPDKLRIFAITAGRNLANGIISGVNAIGGAVNNIEFGIPGFDPPGPGPTFPGITVGTWPKVPTIPYITAETGALLTAPTLVLGGETMKARAGGGEVVSPVATMRQAFRDELAASGGGSTVVINVDRIEVAGVVGDPRRTGAQIAEALDAHFRAGGRIGRHGWN